MLGLLIVRECFSRDPKTIVVVLENLAKITGCKVNAELIIKSGNEKLFKSIDEIQLGLSHGKHAEIFIR